MSKDSDEKRITRPYPNESEVILRDCIELGQERVKSGKLSRRVFLEAMALLGITPVALYAAPAKAQGKPKEIVLANSGGAAVKAHTEAFALPYEKDTGIKIVVEASTTSMRGRIKAMVEAKHVIWDTCDLDPNGSLVLGRLGFLDEIDYSIVDKNKVLPGFAFKWGVVNYHFGYAITYDKTKFGNNPPQNWRDFWNVKDFPGRRAMYKSILGAFEAALMASGLPPDQSKIYPPDEKLAWDMLRQIKPHVLFYSNGAQSEQLLRDGDCTMGSLWNSRSTSLYKETNGRIDFTFNEGFLSAGAWCVPKGNPAGKAVYDFIRSMQIPERQAALFVVLGVGPANPAAASLIPADMSKFNMTAPENARRMLPFDQVWIADNYERLQNEFINVMG